MTQTYTHYRSCDLPSSAPREAPLNTSTGVSTPRQTEQGRFFFNNHYYCSRSEAACADLMERYVPGFRVVEGESMQVPIGADRFNHMRHVDFMVNGVLVEYHQVRFWRNARRYGDFLSPREYRTYRETVRTLDPEERKIFQELTKTKLAMNYTLKREQQIEQSSEHSGRELIVATSPADFYNKVIVRFGRNIPAEADFVRKFQQICARVEPVEERRRRLGRAW